MTYQQAIECKELAINAYYANADKGRLSPRDAEIVAALRQDIERLRLYEAVGLVTPMG